MGNICGAIQGAPTRVLPLHSIVGEQKGYVLGFSITVALSCDWLPLLSTLVYNCSRDRVLAINGGLTGINTNARVKWHVVMSQERGKGNNA